MRDEIRPKIGFVENKPIDFARIEAILAESKHLNHWANFGPASLQLESYIHQQLQLPLNRKVIMTKSGTHALQTLANLHAIKANKKQRWVISSFGFIASNIDTLADAIILDCDRSGVLDIHALEQLDDTVWDGVIVTNIFGLMPDARPFIELCQSKNKHLIIDNAVGYFSAIRDISTPADEIISFHQTKPWGIGEGGCVIVDQSDETVIRKLLNFGIGLDDAHKQFYSNGKISDFSAALILQRLEQSQHWQSAYQCQMQRVLDIIQTTDLNVLSTPPASSTLGHIPCIFTHPIKPEQVEGSGLTFQKYYRPLDTSCKQSLTIYDHIVNIPCHAEVQQLTDSQIVESINLLLSTNLP